MDQTQTIHPSIITIHELEKKYKSNYKEDILKILCDKSIPKLLNIIKKNLKKIINSPYNNICSIMNFSSYCEFHAFDYEMYEDNKKNEYIDILVKYKDENMTDYIYIRWEEEFVAINDCVEQSELKELTNTEKQLLIKNIMVDYVKKFMSGRVFHNLNELYQFLKYNCYNRNNKIIKRKLNIIPKKISDLVINQQKSNIDEILEILDIPLSYNDILDLDSYLCKVFSKKNRNKVHIEKFRTKLSLYEYTWQELGSVEILINTWVNKLYFK